MTNRVVIAAQNPIPDDAVEQTSQLNNIRRGKADFGHFITGVLDDQGAAVPPLDDLSTSYAFAVLTGPLATKPAKLVMLDVDSTLTTTEAVDLLAEAAGSGEQVAEITERAMRGELDFAESLRERVATLAGLPEAVIAETAPRMTLSPGATELVAACKANGARIGVTSGGFSQLVEPLATRLGLDFWNANELEIVDGQLTGRIAGPIVDRQQKARDLRCFAATHEIDLAEAVAVGDGANDLDMLAAAGLGVAYCAKPLTASQADAVIPFPRLDVVAAMAFER